MLEVAFGARLAIWACTAAAVALKAHKVDADFFAALSDLGERTIGVGEALHDRPRDVLREAADRLAARIAREHQAWLATEFRADVAGAAGRAGGTQRPARRDREVPAQRSRFRPCRPQCHARR